MASWIKQCEAVSLIKSSAALGPAQLWQVPLFPAPPREAPLSEKHLRARPLKRRSGGCSHHQIQSRAASWRQRRRCTLRCCDAAAPAASAPACRGGTHAMVTLRISRLNGPSGVLCCAHNHRNANSCVQRPQPHLHGIALNCHMHVQSGDASAEHIHSRSQLMCQMRPLSHHDEGASLKLLLPGTGQLCPQQGTPSNDSCRPAECVLFQRVNASLEDHELRAVLLPQPGQPLLQDLQRIPAVFDLDCEQGPAGAPDVRRKAQAASTLWMCPCSCRTSSRTGATSLQSCPMP
jgi:hypothetical protein